jgi:hypothetical protein
MCGIGDAGTCRLSIPITSSCLLGLALAVPTNCGFTPALSQPRTVLADFRLEEPKRAAQAAWQAVNVPATKFLDP